MGAYINIADLPLYCPERRLCDLVWDEGEGEALTLATLPPAQRARIEAAIAGAEREVNGYLCARYSTPVSPVLENVQLAAAHIAIRRLHNRKPEYEDAWKGEYDAQIEWLEKVREGELSLAGPADVSGEATPIRTSHDAAGSPEASFAGGGLDDF